MEYISSSHIYVVKILLEKEYNIQKIIYELLKHASNAYCI